MQTSTACSLARTQVQYLDFLIDMKGLVTIVALALAGSTAARTFTVFNQCPFTIWYVRVGSAVVHWALTDALCAGLLYVCSPGEIVNI